MDIAAAGCSPVSPRTIPATASRDGGEAAVGTDDSDLVHGHGHAQGRDQSNSLSTQCLNFLEKMKRRFGEHSAQSFAIHDTLGAFRNGYMSKMDAHSNVVRVLGDDNELKQDLENILHHPEAAWGIGDFREMGQGQTPHGFLQPHNESHIRLPSIFAPGFFDHEPQMSQPVQPLQTSINPALLGNPTDEPTPEQPVRPLSLYNEAPNATESKYPEFELQNPCYSAGRPQAYNTQYNQFTDPRPIPKQPSPVQFSDPSFHENCHYPLPTITQDPQYSPYNDNRYYMGYTSPSRQTGYPFQNSYQPNMPWDRMSVGNAMENSSADQLSGYQAPTQGQKFFSPTLSNREPTPQLVSPRQTSSNVTPSVLGDPYAVPLGQPALEMKSPNKRHPHGSLAYMKDDEMQVEEAEEEQNIFRRPSLPSSSSQLIFTHAPNEQQSADQKSTSKTSAEGQFVHYICGKAFSSRSAVKKHHWGNKNNDLETTTGCWAKHNKPNIDWDRHPSCKDNSGKFRATKRRQTSKALPRSEFKAPTVPSMAYPYPHLAPTGREAHQEGLNILVDASHDADPSSSPSQAEIIPYHSSSLPARSSMDTLLTAVNVASRIDAPTPQGRNDSVVSQLDAKVSAKHSHLGFGMPGDAFSQEEREASSQGYQELLSPSDCGSGFAFPNSELSVPENRILPSQQDAFESGAKVLQGASTKANGTPSAPVGPSKAASVNGDGCAENASNKRKPGAHPSVSKREMKMLGLSVSPEPEHKKARN